MTYSLRSFASLGIFLLASNGCDKEESLGEYPTTTSGATDGSATDSGGGSGDDSGTTEGSTTQGSTTQGSATDTSTDSGSATDTGVTGCGPGQCQTFPLECGPEGCGGLSRIDDNGCLRPSCGNDDDCGADELCYRASDFGGCESSDIFCEDDFENMECACGSTDDCGGAYCVPEDVYPMPEAGPTDAAIVTNDCAPDDGPAMSFHFGLASNMCDDPTMPPGPVVHILINTFDDTPNTHEFGSVSGLGWGTYDAGDGVLINAVTGHLTVTSWDMSGVSGDYEIIVEDGTFLAGTFESASYCPIDTKCG